MEGLLFPIIQIQSYAKDGIDVVFVQIERKPSSLEGQSDVYETASVRTELCLCLSVISLMKENKNNPRFLFQCGSQIDHESQYCGAKYSLY